MASVVTVRGGLRYMRNLARLCAGQSVFVSNKVALDHVVLGSEYCKWPLVPLLTSNRSIVYSFGVGQDITFDLAAIERFRCHVYAFDPTPRSIRWVRSQITPAELHFCEFGIGARPDKLLFYPPSSDTNVSYTVSPRQRSNGDAVAAEVLDLRSILCRLKHGSVDILKMDIEGAEYVVIETLAQQGSLPGQLMVEFHHGMYGYTAKNTKQALDRLRQDGYYPYYVSDTWREFGFVHRDSVGRCVS